MGNPFEDRVLLPVWATIAETFRVTVSNFSYLMRIAWIWLIVLSAAAAGLYWTLWPQTNPETQSVGSIWYDYVFPSLISTLIASSVAVAWHRKILLDDASAGLFYMRWDGTVLRYFLWAFAMQSIWLLPYLAGSALSPELMAGDIAGYSASGVGAGRLLLFLTGFAVLAFALFVVPVRLGFVLPALALGHSGYGAIQSWEHTRGNFWRLLFCAIVTVLLPALVGLLVSVVVGVLVLGDAGVDTRAGATASNVLLELVVFIAGIFGLSFLSVAYRRLAGLKQATSQ